MAADQVDFVTGWLCLSCGHASPDGDDPQECCDDRVAMRAGFRRPPSMEPAASTPATSEAAR